MRLWEGNIAGAGIFGRWKGEKVENGFVGLYIA